jgi:hypothetical protein
LDLAEVDRDLTKQLTESLFMSSGILECLEIDFEDIGLPNLSGPVSIKNIYFYVQMKIEKILLEGYDHKCLDAMHEGYKTTVPDYRPSYRMLWNILSFDNVKKITPSMLINSLQLGEDSVEPHNAKCFSSINDKTKQHVCSANSSKLCPLSCLANYLESADLKTLQNFLKYVTSSTVFFDGETPTNIYVQIQKADFEKLPEARTCSHTLILFEKQVELPKTPEHAPPFQVETVNNLISNESSEFWEEEILSEGSIDEDEVIELIAESETDNVNSIHPEIQNEFDRKMNYCLENGWSFGIV